MVEKTDILRSNLDAKKKWIKRKNSNYGNWIKK
jgi:hypothetical protein